MNHYIKKFKDQLPLLKYCEGPGTEEDGIIRHLLSLLDLKSSFFVEFGQRSLGGGTLGRIANERQATLLNIDPEAAQDEERAPWNNEQKWVLKQRSVSPLNINQIFGECGVPCSPAACVIDVDGMDYWCMLAILQNRRPSLLICEYNCHVPADVSASLSFDPGYQYNKDKNYGASLLALRQLAQAHGYRLTHIHGPLNLYFIPENSRAWGSIKEGLDLNYLQAEDLAALSNTEEFYDNFHQGQRPSWYASDAPDFNQPPWIRLDQIGNKVNTITIDEISLSVYQSDKGGDHYKQRGHKEDSVSPLWRLIRHMLEPEVVIDIGANYGYTAVMLSTRLGARRLIAIEPDPRLFSILSANLTQISTICEVETIQAAISRQNDCVTAIGINPVSTQDNRVVPEKSWQEAIVPVCSLDKILESVPRFNRIFIKSDTQGFDVNVIRSGFKELSHRNNWMLRCEFAPHWMESQGFSPWIHLEWLCMHFQVFEAPLRTSWNSRKEEVFARPLEVSHVAGFTEYTRSLNHSGKGWLDLYVLPKDYTYKDDC
jgi:FkbM family methyltransferase